MARHLLVATLRNEAVSLIEWLAWHRMVGFDHALIYTNDCTDPTEPMLARLAALGLVTWVRNSVGFGQKPQRAALDHAITHPLYRGAEWVLHADVDEVVLIHAGAGRLDDLLAALPGVNMISLPWRMFGNSGRLRWTPGRVVEQFTFAAPPYILQPWQITAFKTMHRPLGHWGAIGPHRPYDLRAPAAAIRWVGGSGQAMPASCLERGWRSVPGCFGDDLVQLNHYAVKSADCFLVKSDRGPPTDAARRAGFDYWCLRNINFVEDRRALRHLPGLEAEIAGLLADPELSRLQAVAEDWHRAQIDRLHADPAFADLRARVEGYRPTGSFTTTREGERRIYSFDIPEVANPRTAF